MKAALDPEVLVRIIDPEAFTPKVFARGDRPGDLWADRRALAHRKAAEIIALQTA